MPEGLSAKLDIYQTNDTRINQTTRQEIVDFLFEDIARYEGYIILLMLQYYKVFLLAFITIY